MARRLVGRTDPIITRGRAKVLASSAERLPIELVTEILDYLFLDELWQAAAVSRTFYAAAWHAGLFIHREIRWRPPDSYVPQLATFNEIVRHALAKNLRLSLTFSIFSNDEWDPATRPAYYDIIKSGVEEVLAAVTSALPALIRLSIALGDHFGAQLQAALRPSAPRLEELVLKRTIVDVPCVHHVPSDLFSRFAPNLSQVSLHDMVLGPDPVTAFSRATRLRVEYCDQFPDIAFAHHFPRLSDLRIEFFTECDAPPPQRFDMAGLSLERLCVTDCEESPLLPAVERSIKLADIPVFEHACTYVLWTEPLWQQNKDELSVRIKHFLMSDLDMSIIVVPSHRRWRRAFHLHYWNPESISPINDMPGVLEHVAYLRIDNYYLISFLESEYLGRGMDALRELRIDFRAQGKYATMVWPPDYADTIELEMGDSDGEYTSSPICPPESAGSWYYLYCRNLEKLTLFALEKPVTLQSTEVGFFARALGQCPRPKEQRAALHLVGVDFKKPVAQKLLRKTFSSVQSHAFAGWDSAMDDEDGMWGETETDD